MWANRALSPWSTPWKGRTTDASPWASTNSASAVTGSESSSHEMSLCGPASSAMSAVLPPGVDGYVFGRKVPTPGFTGSVPWPTTGWLPAEPKVNTEVVRPFSLALERRSHSPLPR